MTLAEYLEYLDNPNIECYIELSRYDWNKIIYSNDGEIFNHLCRYKNETFKVNIGIKYVSTFEDVINHGIKNYIYNEGYYGFYTFDVISPDENINRTFELPQTVWYIIDFVESMSQIFENTNALH